MKIFEGRRDPHGNTWVRWHTDTEHGRDVLQKLRMRLDLFKHSPTGFEWGYGGSGPAQLALAILCNVLEDDDRAVRLHQIYKFDVVAKWGREWRLTEAEIMATVERIEAEIGVRA